MNFSDNKPLNRILNGLFLPYAKRVPDVNTVTLEMKKLGLISRQEDIVNDHIAFRTLGISNLGISSFERIFLHYGYTKQDHYFFPKKKLDAYWYKPPHDNYPRVFISELKVGSLSKQAQQIVQHYTKNIQEDPLNQVDLDNVDDVVSFLHKALWELPDINDYNALLTESEYGAWVLYNRYYLNHYTISVHKLPAPYNELVIFNEFLKSIGIKLNDAGGEIKISRDQLLRQSSTVAQTILAKFANGKTAEIAGSYVEFAERLPLPEYAKLPKEKLTNSHRREGFETGNADKIFESTFSDQINKKS
ncbi:MAG: DUF1338 domain-containing protein [Flavobacteriaceae bacterium]|nr:DUF1338 domain-containing protein [Flavobacteriaceae bacterium]